MNWKVIVIIELIVICTAFAFGRYSVPEVVKTEHDSTTVSHTTDTRNETAETHTDRDKHKDVVVTETVQPDGTKTVTTHTIEDSKIHRDTDDSVKDHSSNNTANHTVDKTETIAGRNKLNVSLLVGPSISLSGGLSLGPIAYGAHISKPILGPVTVGLWGLSTGAGGMSVGLNF